MLTQYMLSCLQHDYVCQKHSLCHSNSCFSNNNKYVLKNTANPKIFSMLLNNIENLSYKVMDKELIVLESLSFETNKTKEMVNFLCSIIRDV